MAVWPSMLRSPDRPGAFSEWWRDRDALELQAASFSSDLIGKQPDNIKIIT